jgi:cell division septation protein DedD
MRFKNNYQFSFSKKTLIFMSIGIVFAFILVFILGFMTKREFHQNQPGRTIVKDSTRPEKRQENRIPPKMKSNKEKDSSDLELTFYQTLLKKEGTPSKQIDQVNNVNKSSQIEKQAEQKKPLKKKQRVSKEVKENTKSFKGYTLQVGAFQDKEQARKMANKLEEKGYPVYIVSSNMPMKGMWHRVRVGHFQDIKDAKKLGLTIEMKERLPTYVTFSSD